jgi:hypothetical protein
MSTPLLTRMGLALLNNAVEKRQTLLAFQRDFAKNSVKHADKDNIKGYVFSTNKLHASARCISDL